VGPTDWIAVIGAVTGIVGTVLGLIATYDLLNKNRVKLRVVPKLAWVNRRGAALTAATPVLPEHDPTRGAAPNRLAIEVVNLSAFAVTISDVGFGRVDGPMRVSVPIPQLADGKTWPVRLESREAVTAFCNLPMTSAQASSLAGLAQRVAYAQTDCGAVRYGSSQVFSRFIEQLSRLEADSDT
jgi:hypothetical protein